MNSENMVRYRFREERSEKFYRIHVVNPLFLSVTERNQFNIIDGANRFIKLPFSPKTAKIDRFFKNAAFLVSIISLILVIECIFNEISCKDSICKVGIYSVHLPLSTEK